MRYLAIDRLPVEIGEAHAFRRQHGHIAIGQKKHIARVAQDGGDIRGDEVLAIAQADDYRRAQPRGDDLVRVEFGNNGQGEYPLQFLDCVTDCVSLRLP